MFFLERTSIKVLSCNNHSMEGLFSVQENTSYFCKCISFQMLTKFLILKIQSQGQDLQNIRLTFMFKTLMSSISKQTHFQMHPLGCTFTLRNKLDVSLRTKA